MCTYRQKLPIEGRIFGSTTHTTYYYKSNTSKKDVGIIVPEKQGDESMQQ